MIGKIVNIAKGEVSLKQVGNTSLVKNIKSQPAPIDLAEEISKKFSNTNRPSVSDKLKNPGINNAALDMHKKRRL